MFAVIKTGGKQYRVAAGDIIKVEKLDAAIGDNFEFDEILLLGSADNVKVGTPKVAGAIVRAEVLEQGRHAKVIAFKKRRRQNSKRTRGHRQQLTNVRIIEIVDAAN